MNISDSRHIQLVLFDLGNVVFHIHPERTPEEWSSCCDHSAEELQKGLIACSDLTQRYGTAELSCGEFYSALIERLQIDLSLKDFKRGWNALFGELIEESVDVIRKLSGQVPLAVYSDTNQMHAEAFHKRYPDILASFNRIYGSMDLAARKDSSRGFERILADFDLAPQQVLFFDDSQTNIDIATSLGIQAVQYVQPGVISQTCENYFPEIFS